LRGGERGHAPEIAQRGLEAVELHEVVVDEPGERLRERAGVEAAVVDRRDEQVGRCWGQAYLIG
jgi:hypothetical protein